MQAHAGQSSLMAPPLTGLRVLELANLMAGPFCGLVLADLGADVVKIENPQGGDFSRATPPCVRGVSAGFLALNRNKRSLALDLKAPAGREVFLRLARRADVVLENFRPGTVRDLGIDYQTLREVNPRLVYCSVSGYGQTGPYSQRAGLDLIMQGMSGIMSVTGEPGRPPVKVGVPVADLTAALFAANAIQAALLARERSGQGQFDRRQPLRSRPSPWRSGRPAATSPPAPSPAPSAPPTAPAPPTRPSAPRTATSPWEPPPPAPGSPAAPPSAWRTCRTTPASPPTPCARPTRWPWRRRSRR